MSRTVQTLGIYRQMGVHKYLIILYGLYIRRAIRPFLTMHKTYVCRCVCQFSVKCKCFAFAALSFTYAHIMLFRSDVQQIIPTDRTNEWMRMAVQTTVGANKHRRRIHNQNEGEIANISKKNKEHTYTRWYVQYNNKYMEQARNAMRLNLVWLPGTRLILIDKHLLGTLIFVSWLWTRPFGIFSQTIIHWLPYAQHHLNSHSL